MLYQFVKYSFVAPSRNAIYNFNMFQKNSVFPKTFYLNSFLLLTSTYLTNLSHCATRNRCKNVQILNRKNYPHSQEVPTYLHSQLTKLLLTPIQPDKI